jgi:alkanesulfonate monooxygenase SsuD/methylene tetrahydromethanopterin reductase-like flavin-dependent oxidoreductase (luciferase family)
MNLRELSDEDLATHLDEVLNEQERRARLARAPEQVAAMAAQYVADGGDKAVLLGALTPEPAVDAA